MKSILKASRLYYPHILVVTPFFLFCEIYTWFHVRFLAQVSGDNVATHTHEGSATKIEWLPQQECDGHA